MWCLSLQVGLLPDISITQHNYRNPSAGFEWMANHTIKTKPKDITAASAPTGASYAARWGHHDGLLYDTCTCAARCRVNSAAFSACCGSLPMCTTHASCCAWKMHRNQLCLLSLAQAQVQRMEAGSRWTQPGSRHCSSWLHAWPAAALRWKTEMALPLQRSWRQWSPCRGNGGRTSLPFQRMLSSRQAALTATSYLTHRPEQPPLPATQCTSA